LLVPIHPTGYGKQNEIQLSCHTGRKYSKVFAAQDPRLLRLIFLAVQGSPISSAGKTCFLREQARWHS
jgi:hypothetical protein